MTAMTAKGASMFVHAVYFWLKDDLPEDVVRSFREGLDRLVAIDCVHSGYVGVPAETDRPVIDRSYSFAMVMMFEDKGAHDEYAVHPTHKAFHAEFKDRWSRILVYDSQ